MTEFPSQFWIGFVALALFAGAVVVMYLLRGPAKKSAGQKAQEEGLSKEVVQGGEAARPDEAPHSEMEEGTINSEVSERDQSSVSKRDQFDGNERNQ